MLAVPIAGGLQGCEMKADLSVPAKVVKQGGL